VGVGDKLGGTVRVALRIRREAVTVLVREGRRVLANVGFDE